MGVDLPSLGASKTRGLGTSNSQDFMNDWWRNQGEPDPNIYPERNKDFIAGLKGNQWVFISRDLARFFLRQILR